MDQNKYNKIRTMLGKKYYKAISDDKFEIIRVTGFKNENVIEITREDGNKEKVNPDDVLMNYTELIPDGFMTFSIVTMKIKNKNTFCDDVIVCVHRMTDLDKKDNDPYLVCRQNITDIFYNYQASTENHPYVGLSVTRDTCPANIDFTIIRACDDVSYFIGINFYITDNIEDILNILGSKIKKFNSVLENGMKDFLKSNMKMDIGQIQLYGHCRDLKTLLINNDFELDYNNIFNITPVDFDMKNHIVTAKDNSGDYDTIDEFLRINFSNLFKKNITKSIVVKYDHDIDLEEVLGTYFMVRDAINNVYIILYTIEGEYFDKDLEAEAIKNLMSKNTSILREKYKK